MLLSLLALLAEVVRILTPEALQPPAVESHVLSTGVVLKEGGQTRSGPDRKKDALHMTRR